MKRTAYLHVKLSNVYLDTIANCYAVQYELFFAVVNFNVVSTHCKVSNISGLHQLAYAL